jgi:hypothetical protein
LYSLHQLTLAQSGSKKRGGVFTIKETDDDGDGDVTMPSVLAGKMVGDVVRRRSLGNQIDGIRMNNKNDTKSPKMKI